MINGKFRGKGGGGGVGANDLRKLDGQCEHRLETEDCSNQVERARWKRDYAKSQIA